MNNHVFLKIAVMVSLSEFWSVQVLEDVVAMRTRHELLDRLPIMNDDTSTSTSVLSTKCWELKAMQAFPIIALITRGY